MRGVFVGENNYAIEIQKCFRCGEKVYGGCFKKVKIKMRFRE